MHLTTTRKANIGISHSIHVPLLENKLKCGNLKINNKAFECVAWNIKLYNIHLDISQIYLLTFLNVQPVRCE